MADSSAKKKVAKHAKVVLIWANIAVGTLAVFVILAGGVLVAYAKTYDDRIFPGVQILGVRLDGMTKDDAQKVLDDTIDKALNGGLHFSYRGKDVQVAAITASPDASDARDLVQYQVDDALHQALLVGREGSWTARVAVEMRLRVAPIAIPATVTLDRAAITDSLNTAFQDKLTPPQDASLAVDASTTPPSITVVPEKSGTILLPDQAFDELQQQAQALNFQPIQLSDQAVNPSITSSRVEALVPQAQAYLSRPKLNFTYNTQHFSVPTSTLASWLVVSGTSDNLSVSIDPVRFAASLPKIAPGVEQEGKNGSLVEQDGKIQSFVPGVNGVAIDASSTLAEVLQSWPASSTFPLVTTTTQSKLTGQDPESLGITDLLGVGTSNYGNSPPNRIKNIEHGVALVNGTIIQPGDTFSLIKTLGDIDQAHHWLSELTIKGNKTEPDFGGGLCQIGTTTFRAALASGLPITERANHSYSVSYYAPAGTDATIYDPQPDMRFQNDTSAPILINAYIKGTMVYFEFWGTKDGRQVSYTGTKTVTDESKLIPRVYNVVQPPPPILTQTLSLPVGQKKCSELPHAGEDADFTYTVTSTAGVAKTVDFHSHYRPWQEVCLVGVSKITQPVPTSTSAAADTAD
ncbi:MAG: VanW family protein [Patescibacteria group bacterium]